MNFDTDIETIRRLLQRAGEEPAPGGTVEPREAAVAAILRRAPSAAGRPDCEVLLIRRAEHPSDPWSGHMAFPGGRKDPSDQDLVHTATRETLEEVGVSLNSQGALLGRLPSISALAKGKPVGLSITPFFFEALSELSLNPNYEVAETIWAPIGPLLRGEHDTKYPYQWENQRLSLPAFDIQGRIVWGLTYQMLQAFFSLLKNSQR